MWSPPSPIHSLSMFSKMLGSRLTTLVSASAIVTLLLSILALFFSTPASAGVCNFPAVFNFGDSNSDTGGLSSIFGQVPSPHGETYFRTPSGRYSDGRLIIDFIAEKLGLAHLNAYLDSVGSKFTQGVNFATAGSTIRRQNATTMPFYSPVSLNYQVTQFVDFHRKSQIVRKSGGVYGGILPEERMFSDGLYTIDIGQNDLTAGYKLNLTTEQVKNECVPDIIAQLAQAIKMLYGEGARSFWVHNTAPVGCIPYVLDRYPVTADQTDKSGCASPYNDVAQHFNLKLREAIVGLRKELKFSSIIYVDVYSVKYALISGAGILGFENPFQACCGYGGGKYNYDKFFRCGSKQIQNGKEVIVADSCKNPSNHINWDGIHFTEAANKWIFDKIVGGSYSDPAIPLEFACSKLEC